MASVTPFSTPFGRSLFSAANAAGGRTTLELGTMATQASSAYAALATVNTFALVQTFSSVVINSATPGTLLSVTTAANAPSDSVFISYNARSLFGYSGSYQAAFVSDNGLNKPIVFESGGTEKFRIGNDGNILIGVNSGGAGVSDSTGLGATNGRVYLTVGADTAGGKYPKIVVNGPANGGAGIQFNTAATPRADIGYDNANGWMVISNRVSGEPIVLMPTASGVGIGQNVATAFLDLSASTTARASLRIRNGTRPTTPNAGDFWDDSATVAYQISAATNAIVNSLKLERGSSGTPAAGFGLGIVAQLESSTTETQDAGRLTWEWITATHASRASKGQLTSFYTSTERPAITWGSNSTVALLSFYDVVTPVARPTAYTQTYNTAARTVNAYTTDAEAAYTGQDNLQVGSVYAKYADLEALRVAYTNLEAGFLNVLQVVTSMIDDGQAVGLLQ